VNRVCLGKKRAIRLLLLSVIALFQISLLGCAFCFIPAKQKEPRFVDESVSQISPGTTTKDEVKGILGQPDSIRKNDSIYIYSDSRKVGWLWVVVYPGVGGASDIYKMDHIIIQFTNSGIVQEVDHLYFPRRKKWRTTKNGIFLALADPLSKEVVLYAQPPLDEKAKQFHVPAGKSAIYFYCPRGDQFRGYVSLDGIALSQLTKHGYFFWVVDPGKHQIEITPHSSQRFLPAVHFSINCEEGQIHFVEQTWKAERIFPTARWCGQMRIVDKEEGQSEIKKRRLILDCFCPFE
jgi:outer membrane protein assembly factor BamE (lipoprotein component of BamABCDE complex)